MIERRRCQRYLVRLPVEYWETDDAVLSGVVFNVSETGLLIYSKQDMAIGKELTIKISYSVGYDFETVQSLPRSFGKTSNRTKVGEDTSTVWNLFGYLPKIDRN